MSEAAAIEAPPKDSPQLKGIDSLMADFDKDTTPKPPEKPDTQPDPDKGAPDKSGKAAAKTPEKPAAKDTPVTVDWNTAPKQFREQFETLKKSSEQKIAEFEKRIKDINAKPVEKPADAKLIEEYHAKIDRLQKELAQSAYERSDEFRKNHTDRLNDYYKSAMAEVKQLTVGDGEGENRKERAATEQDFNYILNLPLKDQGAMARRMFGDSADAVLAHRNELFRMQRDMQAALKRAAEEHETRSKEQELLTKKQQETFDKTKSSAMDTLKSKWPHWFAEDAEDAEASAALNGGYSFVKTFEDKAAEMSLEDQAVHAAMIQARAAAFPREVLKNKRLTAKVESLEKELSKFRKSDPGGGGSGASEPVRGEKIGGIAAMTGKFNE